MGFRRRRVVTVSDGVLDRALTRFLAATEVPVERRTKDGVRRFDCRAPVQHAVADSDDTATAGTRSETGAIGPCAILRCVVRHVTPAVRPDDILSGLRSVDPELGLSAPAEARRLAQGWLDEDGRLADPLDGVTQDFRWR